MYCTYKCNREGLSCNQCCSGEAVTITQSASKTPDGFWNFKTSVPAMRRFRTDRYQVQWCLEFSWDEALVSATPICGSVIVYQHIHSYSYTAWFPTAISKTWCSLRQYSATVCIEITSRRISEIEQTTRTSIFRTYTWQYGASKRRHVENSEQVSEAASYRTSLNLQEPCVLYIGRA